MGNVADRCHVGGHVLAHPTITPGRRLNESTAFIPQADGEAVELQLAHEHRDVAVEPLRHPLGPGTELGGVHRIVEAHHGHSMHDRGERGIDRSADQTGR